MTTPPHYAAALAMAILLAGGSARAQPFVVEVTQRVPYGDLDLTTPHGAAVMLRRIERAAAIACDQPHTALLPWAKAEERRCRTEAVARAVNDLGSARVAALHDAPRTAHWQRLSRR